MRAEKRFSWGEMERAQGLERTAYNGEGINGLLPLEGLKRGPRHHAAP